MKPLEETQRRNVEGGVARFSAWLDEVGYASHDPYDLWGTSLGCWARKLYYEKGKIGAVFVAPMLAVDVLFPKLVRKFITKCRYATCDAQLVLAFLNLHKLEEDEKWLKNAVELGEEILGYSIPGYSGHCWGYPFDWQNNKGMWPKNTPFITCTPYCYEAFLRLHEVTGEQRYMEIVESIAKFIYVDLHDVDYSDGAAAGSYSPIDKSMVVNATAYRAYILLEAGGRFRNEDYTAAGMRHIQFVLETQREDGSWLYAVGNNAEEFIDHFHTCFVLKNLWKANQLLKREDVGECIAQGHRYCVDNLFNQDGEPKYFAVEPRFQLARLEMYNYAEVITLGALIGTEVPAAWEKARDLAVRLVGDHQLSSGAFVTRVFRGGFRHTTPFLRWPQAQLFYSLTNLLAADAELVVRGGGDLNSIPSEN